MDADAAGAGEIVIIRNGRRGSRLVPLRKGPSAPFSCDRGRFQIVGDIISPVDVEWEAIMRPDRVLNPEP